MLGVLQPLTQKYSTEHARGRSLSRSSLELYGENKHPALPDHQLRALRFKAEKDSSTSSFHILLFQFMTWIFTGEAADWQFQPLSHEWQLRHSGWETPPQPSAAPELKTNLSNQVFTTLVGKDEAYKKNLKTSWAVTVNSFGQFKTARGIRHEEK